MKSLFSTEAYEEIVSRLNSLSDNSERQWGKMEIGQMLYHCQFPLKLALRKQSVKGKTNTMLKVMGVFFKKSLYNDKPWRHGLPTAKGLKVVEKKDFSQEKEVLLGLVKDFHEEKNRKSWDPHPVFGSFTHEQWGQMQYKHLDHHLRQFGV